MADRSPLAETQVNTVSCNLIEESSSGNEHESTYSKTPEDENKENLNNQLKARKSILKVFDPFYVGSPNLKSSLTLRESPILDTEEESFGAITQATDITFCLDEANDVTFNLIAPEEFQHHSTTDVAFDKDVANNTFALEETELNSETLVEGSDYSFVSNILGDLLSKLQINDQEILLENNESSISTKEDVQLLVDISFTDLFETSSTSAILSENETVTDTEKRVDNTEDNLITDIDNKHPEAETITDGIKNSIEHDILNLEAAIPNLEVVKKLIISKEFDKFRTNLNYLEYPHLICDKAMSDLTDMTNLQEQDICDLKLQLNQSQQARASLELQVRQKEEILIKTQVETQKKEHEIRQLHEKLSAKDEMPSQDTRLQELQEALIEAKAKEDQLSNQLKLKTSEVSEFNYAVDEYEKQFKMQVEDLERVKNEYSTAKRHLANLEIAFSDVHQKYERCKTVIEGYKLNENTLCEDLRQNQETIKKQDERYDALKAHAKSQIDKCNSEIRTIKDKSEIDLTKLNAIIKRLQIKLESVTNLLNQKTKECEGLAELCDEVTGKMI